MKKKVIKITPPLWEIVVINKVMPNMNYNKFSGRVDSIADTSFATSQDELEEQIDGLFEIYPYPQYEIESDLIDRIDAERSWEWGGK